MANHKSSKKRIITSEEKRIHNRYFAVSTRNAIRKLRAKTDKGEAEGMIPEVSGMIDKLAKRNIIHKNKAANLKSKLTKFVASL
jgi:small subunit ribosomal protein S20